MTAPRSADKRDWRECSACERSILHTIDDGWIYLANDGRTSMCDDGAGPIPLGKHVVCSSACRSQAMYLAASPEHKEALDDMARALHMLARSFHALGITSSEKKLSMLAPWINQLEFTILCWEIGQVYKLLSGEDGGAEWTLQAIADVEAAKSEPKEAA